MNAIEQARQVARQSRDVPLNQSEAYLEKAEVILLEHLKLHMTDTDAWLLLARIECNSPLYDHARITHYAAHVLSYDPTNAYALLLIAYADYYLHGRIEPDTFSKLCLAKNDNPEIMAMIEVAKARYFYFFDKNKYEQALEKSVAYSNNQRINCSELGIIYLNQGKTQEGKTLIEHAIKSVKHTFPSEGTKYDPASIEALLAEFYSGTTISDDGYAHLKSILKKFS